MAWDCSGLYQSIYESYLFQPVHESCRRGSIVQETLKDNFLSPDSFTSRRFLLIVCHSSAMTSYELGSAKGLIECRLTSIWLDLKSLVGALLRACQNITFADCSKFCLGPVEC